jgi:hypothetical protein
MTTKVCISCSKISNVIRTGLTLPNDPADTVGEDLTGGYIIKSFGSIIPVPTAGSPPTEFFYGYEYPKTTRSPANRKKYIQQYISSFESAMRSGNPSDPTTATRHI